jgi:hypothetical protein
MNMRYMAHIISLEGVTAGPEKLTAVQDWQVPNEKCVEELPRSVYLLEELHNRIQEWCKTTNPAHTKKKPDFPVVSRSRIHLQVPAH